MIPKIQIKKKIFFKILNLKKIRIPKNMTPKSQAKNKTLKKVPWKQICKFKLYNY